MFFAWLAIGLTSSLSASQCANLLSRTGGSDALLDFSRRIGAFASEHQLAANPDNMAELLRGLMGVSFEHSRLYDPRFLAQAEQSWKDRIHGSGEEQAFSWGVNDDREPAARRLFALWTRSMDKYPKTQTPNLVSKGRFKDELLMKYRNPDARWDFSMCLSRGRRVNFVVYKNYPSEYFAQEFRFVHAHPSELPEMMQCLKSLWSRILKFNPGPRKNKIEEEVITEIPRFEWLWFRANPPGRGGAITGSGLSFFLHMKARAQGLEISMPETFLELDLHALSLSLEDYLAFRMEALVGR